MPTITADERRLFRDDFSHEDQVRLCAQHLELMRSEMGEAWWTWSKVKPGKGKKREMTPSREGWTPERVGLAGHFVRHATESADFWATVDFVTAAALAAIRSSCIAYPRKTTFHLKQWSHFTHEHMVPGAAVLRLLTDVEDPRTRGPLYPLLSELSYRALVTGTKRKLEEGLNNLEVVGLDTDYASCLPTPGDVPGWPGPVSMRDIPACHYALMRYDAAGLLNELIAVTTRGQDALNSYLGYKAAFSSALVSLELSVQDA